MMFRSPSLSFMQLYPLVCYSNEEAGVCGLKISLVSHSLLSAEKEEDFKMAPGGHPHQVHKNKFQSPYLG